MLSFDEHKSSQDHRARLSFDEQVLSGPLVRTDKPKPLPILEWQVQLVTIRQWQVPFRESLSSSDTWNVKKMGGKYRWQVKASKQCFVTPVPGTH